MARAMKDRKPGIKIAFVGPHVQIKPAESLLASPDLDFVVRGEFDHSVVEFAMGKPLSEILNVSYVKNGKVVHNPPRPLQQTHVFLTRSNSNRMPFPRFRKRGSGPICKSALIHGR